MPRQRCFQWSIRQSRSSLCLSLSAGEIIAIILAVLLFNAPRASRFLSYLSYRLKLLQRRLSGRQTRNGSLPGLERQIILKGHIETNVLCAQRDWRNQPLYNPSKDKKMNTHVTSEPIPYETHYASAANLAKLSNRTSRSSLNRNILTARGILLDSITHLNLPSTISSATPTAHLNGNRLAPHYIPTNEPTLCAYRRAICADIHSVVLLKDQNKPFESTFFQRLATYLEILEHGIRNWLLLSPFDK